MIALLFYHLIYSSRKLFIGFAFAAKTLLVESTRLAKAINPTADSPKIQGLIVVR